MGRMIPFVAIAAANCINIPLVRQRELKNGIAVYDREGNCYGQSQVSAGSGRGETRRGVKGGGGVKGGSLEWNRYLKRSVQELV